MAGCWRNWAFGTILVLFPRGKTRVVSEKAPGSGRSGGGVVLSDQHFFTGLVPRFFAVAVTCGMTGA